jgi:uncharacterized protein YcaQ
VGKLGFVQADPIRCPARAQDLILRHRVTDYRAGDLDRKYRSLGLEEDLLYAYGFMPRTTWRLLHPRPQRALTPSERDALAIVSGSKGLHPRELESRLGKSRETNDWGGHSASTTRDLERLHYLGQTRVSGRKNGIRLYEKVEIAHDPMEPDERLRRLVLLIVNILAPLPETSLRAAVQHLRHAAPDLPGRRQVVATLLQTGELESMELDRVSFVWPGGRLIRKEPEETVRFLAPFDPVVWDRARFELFWGWRYRFEAYIPPDKRKLGYYAMPLLWNTDVVGWVNVEARSETLAVVPGFIRQGVGADPVFRRAFDEEVDRVRLFLS